MSESAKPSSLGLEIAYKILNAQVRAWPYPHVIIDDWLPEDLYNRLCEEWPTEKFRPISEVRPTAGYPDRSAVHEAGENVPTEGAWAELYEVTHGLRFAKAWLDIYDRWLRQRFLTYAGLGFQTDSLLCEDKGGYALGPHSDAPQKVMSIVAYFPRELKVNISGVFGPTHEVGVGTSVYATDGFTCKGGPHYKADDPRFTKVFRTTYKPNSLFCLCKTDNSFHGVERLPEGAQRRVYIWNLRTAPV